jgi:dephospho-CoA kinase
LAPDYNRFLEKGMRLVGLTVGIASGKSTFAAALRALGAPVLDADQLARAAVAKGTPGLAAVVAAFGPAVLTPDGELDRKRMASRVFSDPAARARLEAIVHPEVRARFRGELARLEAEGHRIVFYDVPLLFEARQQEQVDLAVVVWAPREAQVARLLERDGLSRQEAEARLAAQLPIDAKAGLADVVVLNDGAAGALAAKAARLLADVRDGLPRRLSNAAPARY